LVLIAAACAGSAPDGSSEPAEPPPCRPGQAAPVSERAFKKALAAEGIRLRRDAQCLGRELVLLSNITDAISSDQEDSIMASQGHIICELYEEKVTSARIERYVWRNDPDPTYLAVLNIHCAVFPETRTQTDAVERALRSFPGVSPLPRTVPSADAVPD
jgi:hypothetical protein